MFFSCRLHSHESYVSRDIGSQITYTFGFSLILIHMGFKYLKFYTLMGPINKKIGFALELRKK
jgi:hypothetical protein